MEPRVALHSLLIFIYTNHMHIDRRGRYTRCKISQTDGTYSFIIPHFVLGQTRDARNVVYNIHSARLASARFPEKLEPRGNPRGCLSRGCGPFTTRVSFPCGIIQRLLPQQVDVFRCSRLNFTEFRKRATSENPRLPLSSPSFSLSFSVFLPPSLSLEESVEQSLRWMSRPKAFCFRAKAIERVCLRAPFFTGLPSLLPGSPSPTPAEPAGRRCTEPGYRHRSAALRRFQSPSGRRRVQRKFSLDIDFSRVYIRAIKRYILAFRLGFRILSLRIVFVFLEHSRSDNLEIFRIFLWHFY